MVTFVVADITNLWPVPNYTAWWQKHWHNCVKNNLPRVIIWKWNGWQSNLRPPDREFWWWSGCFLHLNINITGWCTSTRDIRASHSVSMRYINWHLLTYLSNHYIITHQCDFHFDLFFSFSFWDIFLVLVLQYTFVYVYVFVFIIFLVSLVLVTSIKNKNKTIVSLTYSRFIILIIANHQSLTVMFGSTKGLCAKALCLTVAVLRGRLAAVVQFMIGLLLTVVECCVCQHFSISIWPCVGLFTSQVQRQIAKMAAPLFGALWGDAEK